MRMVFFPGIRPLFMALAPMVTMGCGDMAAPGSPGETEAVLRSSGGDAAVHVMRPQGSAGVPEANGVGAGYASTSNDLYYHGGTGGIGVETRPRAYVVFWGSQWTNNDPSGEAAILESFLSGVGGSTWNGTVTQYCQGVPSGTYYCNGSGQAAGNQTGVLAGYWYDNAAAAPPQPTQAQLATEAVSAARHFGNTAMGSNASVQYIIATSHGNSSPGFGVQYCAWHSSTSSSYGNVAYTNLPYITDAGLSCGANFNGLGPKAGITIVGGHELAETETDQFPSTGWLDSGGSEIGDKCVWRSSGTGAAANITLSTGTFPVQSLWSNACNSGSGGCALSSATTVCTDCTPGATMDCCPVSCTRGCCETGTQTCSANGTWSACDGAICKPKPPSQCP